MHGYVCWHIVAVEFWHLAVPAEPQPEQNFELQKIHVSSEVEGEVVLPGAHGSAAVFHQQWQHAIFMLTRSSSYAE